MLDTGSITARQNQDGGWPYTRGVSCTEPTAYALLALAASDDTTSVAVKRGYDWLARSQRSDGGWAPRPQVDQSTWVTALVILLPDDAAVLKREAGLQWLVTKSGRESTWLEGLRSLLLDGHVGQSGASGWPWFPDTVAWVTPTCFGVLALEKANHVHPSRHIEKRCAGACQYLLLHKCRDDGWNHGSTKALGYDSDSYPETTGQALLALHNLDASLGPSPMDRALHHFASCQSQEALNWLKLGLLAQGVKPPDRPMPPGHGTLPEIAIAMLAETAARGRNIFLG